MAIAIWLMLIKSQKFGVRRDEATIKTGEEESDLVPYSSYKSASHTQRWDVHSWRRNELHSGMSNGGVQVPCDKTGRGEREVLWMQDGGRGTEWDGCGVFLIRRREPSASPLSQSSDTFWTYCIYKMSLWCLHLFSVCRSMWRTCCIKLWWKGINKDLIQIWYTCKYHTYRGLWSSTSNSNVLHDHSLPNLHCSLCWRQEHKYTSGHLSHFSMWWEPLAWTCNSPISSGKCCT